MVLNSHKRLIILALLFIGPFLKADNVTTITPNEEYTLGPHDLIEINVWDHPDLKTEIGISLDGFINYYLIGRIRADGLTASQLAETITKHLADGYLVNPQVSVKVIEYKSKKVTISGEITRPGPYFLRKKTYLVEAIALAGGETDDADNEIYIIRKKLLAKEENKKADGKNNEFKEHKIIVDLILAQEGNQEHNLILQNNDYIFVPRAPTFFILGEVRKPGKYNLKKGTTLLKAISLAGGKTEKASARGTRVIRKVNDKKIRVEIKDDDLIQPGDTIIVPESFF